MTGTRISNEAVEAAATAIGAGMLLRRPPAQLAAEALALAAPIIAAEVEARLREELANQIEARRDEVRPVDDTDGEVMWTDGYRHGLIFAARVVRGNQEATE